MTGDRQLRALGLMSGTSMDGIDAAIVETDGVRIHHRGPSIFLPYTEDWRARLRGAVADGAADEALIDGLTRLHAEAVQRCLAEAGLAPQSIDVIGFHGQTILHDPANGVTLQIGDGDLLAALTGVSAARARPWRRSSIVSSARSRRGLWRFSISAASPTSPGSGAAPMRRAAITCWPLIPAPATP